MEKAFKWHENQIKPYKFNMFLDIDIFWLFMIGFKNIDCGRPNSDQNTVYHSHDKLFVMTMVDHVLTMVDCDLTTVNHGHKHHSKNIIDDHGLTMVNHG